MRNKEYEAFDRWYDKQIERKRTDELDREYIDDTIPAYEKWLMEKYADEIAEFENVEKDDGQDKKIDEWRDEK